MPGESSRPRRVPVDVSEDSRGAMPRTRRTALVGINALGAALVVTVAFTQSSPPDAPAGFDDLTNGLVSQAQFDLDRETFEEREGTDDGLGPVYNAQSCAECHQNPVTGAISQITELRAGRTANGAFTDHPGGSLINDRAIDANFQERVLGGNDTRTFRTSLNTLGDGFVEAVSSNTLIGIANSQPAALRGTVIQVPVNEAGNALRV